jgi:hypothetical protein
MVDSGSDSLNGACVRSDERTNYTRRQPATWAAQGRWPGRRSAPAPRPRSGTR